MAKLEDVCEILDSKRVPITAKDRNPGPYPYYGANGIQDYVSDYIFDDELVLLAEDGGNFGSKEKPIAYRISGKCWVNNHAHVLKPLPNINVDYLCYSLMFYDVSSIVNGATRQKLTQADMRTMEIPLLELSEQKAIVNKLDNVTSLISLRQKQLEKLDELVKSRFIEMFGDCKDTIALNDLCSIITDGTHQPPKFQKEGIPFIFVSNLSDNKVTYKTEKFISEETYNQLYERTPIQYGDILLSTVGSYGHPAVVVDKRKFLFQRHIAYLKPKSDLVNSFFLHSAILAPDGQRQIEERVKGIAQKTLNLSEIRKIRIPIPSIEEQNAFEDFIKQTDKSKLAVQKSITKCHHLTKKGANFHG